MSKKNYILPLALLISGAVNAATESENPWYAGARLGGTHYSDFSGASVSDKDDIGGGVFLGYNFTPAFAIETGYTHLGEIDLNGGSSIEQQGVDLVGKFTWNTSDSLNVFAKAGGFYYFTDGQGGLDAYEDSGLAATAGLGLEYLLTKNVSARLEYQYYHDIDLDDTAVDVNWDTHFYGLSLVYAWGGSEPMAMIEEPMISEPEPVAEPQPLVEPKMMEKIIEVAPLTVELPFNFDSDQLSDQYLQQLAPIAQHLIDYPEAKLFVVGHTDSRGSEAYNQKLSEQRAALIADYLADKFAIDSSRINQLGRGELEPRASNDTDAGRAQNRRVSVFTPGLKIQNK